MKRLRIYSLPLLFAAFIFFCGDIDMISARTPETMVPSATDTVLNTELKNDYAAKFEILHNSGKLKKIEGDTGSFHYEVNPGTGLILFSEAKNVVLTAIPKTNY